MSAAGVPGRGEYLNENEAEKPTSLDQLHRVAEIGIGLAGEADDEIGGKGEHGLRRAQAIDDAQIIVAGVTPVHGVENAVRSRLHRQMQLRHQFGQVAMRGDEAVVDVARMARGVAQALDAGNGRETLEQLRKRVSASVRSLAVIGIDVLADHRDLADAGIRQALRFLDDLCDRTRHFGAARIGHDAEGAELVAAFLDGDEGGDAARAHRLARRVLQKIEFVFRREFGFDRPFAARGLFAAVRAGDDSSAVRPPDRPWARAA